MTEDAWDAPRFTCEYRQPESYRFSLDSILLAKAAARDFRARPWPANAQVLDLCAGAGVVGLEFAHLETRAKNFDFVEIQGAYHPFFQANLAASRALDLNARWIEANYRDLGGTEMTERYDLVLCNPPYFEATRGRLPPDPLKARSRFFLDAGFSDLVTQICHVLKPGGRAYLLTRDQKDHGGNRAHEIHELIAGRARLEKTEDLRGTDLQILTKL